MTSFVPPQKNAAFTFYVSLVSQASAHGFQANPTLAAGDVKITIDDGAPANLAVLPVVDADFTKRVKVVLSAAEMNGDNVTIIFSDVAGAEWDDLTVNLQTAANIFDTVLTGDAFARLGAPAGASIAADIAAISAAVFPAGAIEFTYTVTNSVSGLPLDGVEVWFSTDIAGANIVWSGATDAFGVARDVNGNKPHLDAGTYYIWRQLAGYVFSDPDTEVVS